jgi:cytochrome c oxidase subunit 2
VSGLNHRSRPKRVLSVAAIACLLLLVSCAGNQQSIVDPAGPQAGKIAGLWWLFFYLLGAVFLLVMIVMLWTLTRRHRDAEGLQQQIDPIGSELQQSNLQFVVTTATGATVLILFVLLFVSVRTGKATADLGKKGDPLTIEVTGNQWWWQFRYLSKDPYRTLTTANEIHIPVGRPIFIQGLSNDVIHSFWVPNLHGKRDLIPSRVTTEYLQADHPGVYRGECAEFCGLQHAHMAFYVIAEPEDKFEAWMQAQLQPASTPADAILAQGQQNFLNYECVYCHQIRGTTAAGQNGPDLTHFGSRRTLAAGTLPNTLGNLGGWIVNPQSVKPGNHMATIAIAPDDLQPLIQYLESLK